MLIFFYIPILILELAIGKSKRTISIYYELHQNFIPRHWKGKRVLQYGFQRNYFRYNTFRRSDLIKFFLESLVVILNLIVSCFCLLFLCLQGRHSGGELFIFFAIVQVPLILDNFTFNFPILIKSIVFRPEKFIQAGTQLFSSRLERRFLLCDTRLGVFNFFLHFIIRPGSNNFNYGYILIGSKFSPFEVIHFGGKSLFNRAAFIEFQDAVFHTVHLTIAATSQHRGNCKHGKEHSQ